MKFRIFLSVFLAASLLFSCQEKADKSVKTEVQQEVQNEFEYLSEQFADLRVLRYQIPGFDELSLQQKKYVYYLTQAGLSGRDIIYDQNYRHNLKIRRALEKAYAAFTGDKSTEEWKNFEIYLKRIWFSNGIHHHYANDKFAPGFTKEFLSSLLQETGVTLEGEALEVIFNDADNKKVNLNPEKGLISGSATNFYDPGITAAEVEAFYAKFPVDEKQPVELGLNSKLVKQNGVISEKVWKSGGMYGESIDKIIY